MSIALEQKQGLIAGDGLLPVKMAQYAKENGFDVVAISLSNDNYSQLKKYCSKVLLMIIEELEKIGITILDQTLFIKNLMIPSGVLGKVQPTSEQVDDVNYGYWLAKESGKLDIGQSVVIKDKMIMAVEAIEGTDKCIKRGCKIAKKNSRVIKVAKPHQDKRFDIPAIGLRTLKTMKKYKADLIAVEAGETIIVDQEDVIKYANKHNIVIMAV